MKCLFTIAAVLSLQCAFAKTIVVGKNQLVTSLRTAVAMANANDTILLKNGVYREGNIVINKNISIIGIDQPILDGENKYEILTVSGRGILIKGIKFINSGYSSMNDLASINIVDASGVLVENNIIERAYFAIHVANSRNCIIRDNVIIGAAQTEQTSGNGIHLWKCDGMRIEYNKVQGHRDGIYFEFVTHSTVKGNNSHDNIRYGLHFMFSNNDAYVENSFSSNGAGVAVMFSHHVTMTGNVFYNNWGPSAYGLLLKEISDAVIEKNKFTSNTVGILMESTNRVHARQNNFKRNGWAMRVQASCSENTIHQNNFLGNTFDVATNGTLMLNKFSNNYWDKYEGYDRNRDAIGDVPYHPVSMYSMIIEQNPNAMILLRSFMVSLLDRAEKAVPSLTPDLLVDESPSMKRIPL